MFFIRHPKGEGSWGKSEWIPIIRGYMIPFIQRFLEERTEHLKNRSIDSPYLFVNPKSGMPFTTNMIRRIKEQIEKETGVDFKLKDFRSTCATFNTNTPQR